MQPRYKTIITNKHMVKKK